MKYYIAARSVKQPEVERIYTVLEKLGHEVTFKWPRKTDLGRPYRNSNSQINIDHAKSDLLGATKADVFVLLSERNMRGTYVEMGAYLGQAIVSNRQPSLYIINLEDVDEHIFESFENTHFYSNVDEFLKSLE